MTGKNYVEGGNSSGSEFREGDEEAGAGVQPLPEHKTPSCQGGVSIYATDTVVRNQCPVSPRYRGELAGQAWTFGCSCFRITLPKHRKRECLALIAHPPHRRTAEEEDKSSRSQGHCGRDKTLVDAEVRVGQVRAHNLTRFMSQMYTGFVDAPRRRQPFGQEWLEPRAARHSPRALGARQGILEVAIPIQPMTTTCLINMACVDTKQQESLLGERVKITRD